MQHRDPPGNLAPHIPADAYERAQATGQPIIITVPTATQQGVPWRRLLIPVAIAAAAAAGCWGLVAAVCALLDAATHAATVIAGAAGPLGVGGITLRLTRDRH